MVMPSIHHIHFHPLVCNVAPQYVMLVIFLTTQNDLASCASYGHQSCVAVTEWHYQVSMDVSLHNLD